MLKIIITAIITYLVTSIDEIPVLFMLYTKSSNRGKVKVITTAYFTGTFLLIAAGLLGAFGLVLIPVKWAVGMIGLLPLAMGIKILIKGDQDEEEALAAGSRRKTIWTQVLAITLALGADDLGVYIPLFTTISGWQVLMMLAVFAIGTGILCFISYRLTHIDTLTEFIEKRERIITGLVFIAIGILVLYEGGTVQTLFGLIE